MNSLFPRASLNRSTRTRTQKNTIPAITVDESLPSRSSSVLSRRKTRPPPLQIIPELSESELSIDSSPTSSPTTARPAQFPSQQGQLDSPRVTLSAYTFSIDDALLMFGDEPRSPALSASSSTTDGASSEDVLATPGASDDEGDLILPMFRIRPQRVSIRPLCITKTRSMICQDDEDIHACLEKDEETHIILPLAEAQSGAMAVTTVVEEADQDFYAREFEDFISFSPVVPSHCPPARRDSLTLVLEVPSMDIDVPESKPQGRSRLSKPLPLLPPITPPMSSFPLMFPLVQTTAHTSVVRRKRNVPSLANYSLPAPLGEARPLPRMAVPLDIEDCVFPQEEFDDLSHVSVVNEQLFDANRFSLVCTPSASTHPLPPAIAETPLSEMYGDEVLPRSSTDSDAPRSSIDSNLSFTSSFTSSTPTSPISPSFECPEFEDMDRLRSRWSSSTFASVPEPPRMGALLSPLRNVLGSRVRRLPAAKLPTQMRFPSKHLKNKHTTPSPPETPERHNRQQGSPSSTSSGGTRLSEYENHDGSPRGPHKKPIPMLMFLRSTSSS